jgi:hypothetical protein
MMGFAGIAAGESRNSRGPNKDEMARALAILTDPGLDAAFELRAIATTDGILPKAVPSLFTAISQSAAVDRAVDHHWNGYTTYLGLNPVGQGVPLGPGRAVRTDDVLRRRWLLLDIDPARPAGFSADSATDAEKAAAERLAGRVLAHLTAAGWPAPVRVDSGNGAYLLYRIDLPNDEAHRKESHALVKSVLDALGQHFSGPGASVDTSVADAPRIAKLPGGWARKGPGTPDRPHRLCRLVEVPETIQVVTREQLEQLANTLAGPAPSAPEQNGHTSGFSGTATGGARSIPERAIAYLASCPPAISGKGGHAQTFDVARSIVWGFDLGPEIGFDLLWQHYNSRCLPPWSEQELRHKCKEADAVPFDKPRGWLLAGNYPLPASPTNKPKTLYRPLPPFRPFPLDTLPSVLSRFVGAAADAIGCQPAAIAGQVLAVVAGCIGNAAALRVKRKWIEPAIIWALLVAKSGEVKSPCYQVAVDPLLDIQIDITRQYRQEEEKYKQDLERWQDAPKATRGDRPQPPEKPVTYITNDATIEAVVEILEDNPRGLLLARDEMDAWFRSLTRYQGKGDTTRPHWLEFHRAGTLLWNRRTGDRRRLVVPRAAVSEAGTIQRDILKSTLDQDALQAGLGARFLLTMAPAKKRKWSEVDIPEEIAEHYQLLLRALLKLPLADAAKRRPHILELSPEAKALWIEFFNEWGEVQFAAEGEQAAAFAKIEGYALRLMLIHHVVSHVATRPDTFAPAPAGAGQHSADRLPPVSAALSLTNFHFVASGSLPFVRADALALVFWKEF